MGHRLHPTPLTQLNRWELPASYKLEDWESEDETFGSIVSEDFCKRCLDLYNSSSDIDNVKDSFRRCQIFTNIDQNPEIFKELKTIIRTVLNRYRNEVDIGTLHFVNTVCLTW